MAAPADEEDALDALFLDHRVRMFALPFAGVSAPNEQRGDWTEPGSDARVRPKQQGQSLDRRKPTDVQQHRTHLGRVDENCQISQGVSDAARATSLVPSAWIVDEP